MAYGRSPIAPYYLNTIAKARAEKDLLEKRIKAEKEAAAKDRWFRAGMSVVDIGARFGMQAYDDYLKGERTKVETIGTKDAVVAGFKDAGDAPKPGSAAGMVGFERMGVTKPQPTDAPISAKPPATPAPTPPPSMASLRPGDYHEGKLRKPTAPPLATGDRLPAPPRTKMTLPGWAQQQGLPETMREAADVSPALAAVTGREQKLPPVPKTELELPERMRDEPAAKVAPVTANEMAKEDPQVTAPPQRADGPVMSWRKKYYLFASGAGEWPGMPPKVSNRDLEQRGYLQSDGSYISKAEMRKKYPNDTDLYNAVFTSKILEKNKLDVDLKRAQVELMAYERQMRPAKFLSESIELQEKVFTRQINDQVARRQYQQLLFKVQEYNRGTLQRGTKGRKAKWIPPPVQIEISGSHPRWTDLPNIHLPADYMASGGGGGKGKSRSAKPVDEGTPGVTDHAISKTWARKWTEGSSSTRHSVRLTNLKAVDKKLNVIRVGLKGKDPHGMMQGTYYQLVGIRNEMAGYKPDSEEFRSLTHKFAIKAYESNYQHLTGSKPPQDYLKKRYLVEPGRDPLDEKNLIAYAPNIPQKRVKADADKGKDSNTLDAIKKLESARRNYQEKAANISFDRIAKSNWLNKDGKPARFGSLTVNRPSIDDIEAGWGSYEKRLGELTKKDLADVKRSFDSIKGAYDRKLKSIEKQFFGTIKRDFRHVYGVDLEAKHLRPFLESDYEIRSQKISWPSYDSGGPVKSDGFLTDKSGKPYARVHKGEYVVPTSAADGMGLNAEQNLWLKWERQDLPKERKKSGFARDLRILRKPKR